MGSYSVTNSDTTSHSTTNTTQKGQSSSQSQSTTNKFLDEALRNQILSGLLGYMTDEEIRTYAENLLRPQLNAGLEGAQQQYDATELAKQQEMENLNASLARSIEAQQSAYAKSRASLETAALARGMGRSSYTLSTLANADIAYAKAVENLTSDAARAQSQVQQQISLAAQQYAQTQARLKTDYAQQLSAKIQELKQQQRQEYNSNYLTAVSGSLGTTSKGTQETQSSSESHSVTDGTSHTTSVTYSGSTGGGRVSNSDRAGQ